MSWSANIQFKYIIAALALLLFYGCSKQSSEEYYADAQQFIAENNPDAAIVALKNAIQVEPSSADARFALGQLYLQQKQFESAEKEFNRALEFGYDAVQVLPLLSEAYQQTGAYVALSKLEHDTDGLTSVERAKIGFFKVQSLVRLNKSDDARLLIEDLRTIDTSSVFKGLTAAYTLVLDEDYAAATEAVSKLREQAPQNAEVLKLLAQLHLSTNQPNDAAQVYEEYLQFYPEDLQTTFVLAKLWVDLGEPAKAEPYVDALLLVNNENPNLNQLKAAINANKGDYSLALERAEFAINAGVDVISLRLIAGFSAYQIQDFASANRHLSYIVSDLPNNHPGLKLLAASQLQLGLTSDVGDVLGRLDQLSEVDAPLFSRASYQLLQDGYEKQAKVLIDKSSDISRTAEDLTRLGLLQLSLNNLNGIVNLEEAVAKSPDLTSAQKTLARAYIATKQFDKALELASQWKETSPADVEPFILAGEVYIQQQKFAEAQTEFEKATALEDNNPAPKLAMVTLAVIQKDMQLARTLVDQILLKFPNNAPALAMLYMVGKQTNDKEVGLEKIQQVFATDPNNIEVRMLLARVYLIEKNYADTIPLLVEIKDKSNLPQAYWSMLGRSYIRTNQRRKASDHYDAWLQAEPNNKDAVLGKLLLLDNQNKFAEATVLTQTFLSNREDLQLQLLDVYFLLMQAKYTEAQQGYDALPELVLDRPVTKGFLARFQLNNKQPELALENAKIAYNATPNNRNLALLIFIYETLKQPQQVLALLKQNLQSQPNNVAAQMLLAERLIGSDTSAAIELYQSIIEKNSANYVVSNNLAYLHLQQGNIEIAKEYGLNAVELQPNNPAALDTLAQIYVAEQDYSRAIELYDRAVTDEMRNEEIYLNYVEALLLSGNKVIGERRLKQREMQQQGSIEKVQTLKQTYGIE